MLGRKSIISLQKHSIDIKRNASHIGFIGIGNMGSRMVTNLIKKGEKVHVYDVVPALAKSVAGAKVCGSVEEAVKDADLVITSLPTGEIVHETFLAPNGILKGMSKNKLFIDCSTIPPKLAQEISKIATKNGIKFMDAPVSGGITGAGAGTLTFMLGGDKENVKTLEPVLLKMGARIFHCGKIGAGQVAKLCVNLILASTMMATSEGYNLGIKSGLDPKVLHNVLNVSTARSWSSETYSPVPGLLEGVPSTNNYEPGFTVALMAKDLSLVESTAVDIGVPVPLTATTHQMYRVMMAHGLGGKDFSIAYKYFKG